MGNVCEWAVMKFPMIAKLLNWIWPAIWIFILCINVYIYINNIYTGKHSVWLAVFYVDWYELSSHYISSSCKLATIRHIRKGMLYIDGLVHPHQNNFWYETHVVRSRKKMQQEKCKKIIRKNSNAIDRKYTLIFFNISIHFSITYYYHHFMSAFK